MKRSHISDENTATINSKKMKSKMIEDEESSKTTNPVLLDENLLFEVLKHVDARTLGAAACVNRQWNRSSMDERLWEMICTRDYAGTGGQQLRSVVLALGGFRRLHSQYLSRLSKPSSSSSAPSTSEWPCLPPPPPIPVRSDNAVRKSRWGKDEVELSLCLLSIRCFEKMNFSNQGN